MIRSHVFESSDEAYSATSTDAIRDGDVLLVPNEGCAAVAVGPWPIYVGPSTNAGVFHPLATGTFRDLEGGRYLAAATVAVVLLTVHGMKTAGLGVDKRLLDIAREHGWAGEVPPQERLTPERDDSWGAG